MRARGETCGQMNSTPAYPSCCREARRADCFDSNGAAKGTGGPGPWSSGDSATPREGRGCRMKSIGLVGVPYSGKSTLFTSLTRAGAVGGRANLAVVPIPDHRLKALADLEGSKKIVPAQVRFVDVPGGTSSQGLGQLREADALCVVLRAFGPSQDPVGELSEVTAELIIADLAVVETALDNARRKLKGR